MYETWVSTPGQALGEQSWLKTGALETSHPVAWHAHLENKQCADQVEGLLKALSGVGRQTQVDEEDKGGAPSSGAKGLPEEVQGSGAARDSATRKGVISTDTN